MTGILRRSLSVIVLLAAISSAASAQTDTMTYQGKPIIVTATRVPQSWYSIPLAISLISQENLNQARGYGLDEVLSSVPGVLAQSRYGNQDVRFTIRGFGARGAGERSNSGTSRGVRVLLDGFPETEPDGRTSFDLIDIGAAGRIEMSRSNASAIWGNAAGGVLNVLSKTEFADPTVDAQSAFGSFGYSKQVVNAGIPIGSGNFFFTMTNSEFDGWREHSASSRQLINSGIVSSLGPRTELGVYLTASKNSFHIPGPLTQAQFDADPKQAQNDPANYNPTYVQRDERRLNRLGRIGVRLIHNLNEKNKINAQLFASPKYLQRSERNTFRDFTRYHVGGSFTYSNTSVLSPKATNTLLIGSDEAYQDGAILFYSLANGQRGETLRDNKREGANNFGAFVQDQFTLSERVSFVLGGRYDNITYYSDSYITPAINAKKSFERVTPKAGVNYSFSPTHSIYANIGGGVEVPAGNETDPPGTFGADTATAINPLLDAIRSTTVEVGTKHNVLISDNRFLKSASYDVALYLIETRNDIIPYRGGRFYFTAGKTRRTGAEAALNLQSQSGLTLRGALTLSRNRYVDYVIDSVHYGVAGATADLKDNKMAGVPEAFYRASLRYAPELLHSAYAEVSFQGVGMYFADDYNTIEVKSYSIWSGSVGIGNLTLTKSGLFLRGFVGINNISDKKYAASAFINPDLSSATHAPIFLEPGLPRNWVTSLSLGWNF